MFGTYNEIPHSLFKSKWFSCITDHFHGFRFLFCYTYKSRLKENVAFGKQRVKMALLLLDTVSAPKFK